MQNREWGLLCLAFALFSCGGADTTRENRVRIGFSLDSLVVERWARDVDAFLQAAQGLDAEVILKIAGQDPEEQNEQVRTLINRDIDVLVVVPNDWRILRDGVALAKRMRIPVLSYDRLVRESGVDLYISFDNVRVGRLMASALAQVAPEGEWILVHGAEADDNAVQLAQGFSDILTPLLDAGRIRILGEIRPATWSTGEVIPQVESLLGEGQGVTGIIAANDMFASAVIQVLAENRLTRTIQVVGQDADLAACQRIAEGTQHATVYKPVQRLGSIAAEYAVKLAKKEALGVTTTIFDGRYEVPFVALEPILVTRELLDSTVIADGFHKAEDVYRRVR